MQAALQHHPQVLNGTTPPNHGHSLFNRKQGVECTAARPSRLPDGLYGSNMSLQLRWAQDDELDRVALTRMRAYAPAAKELPTYQEKIRLDPRAGSGDFLLAEAD